VVQNEINNLGFLTGETKTNMSKVHILHSRSHDTRYTHGTLQVPASTANVFLNTWPSTLLSVLDMGSYID